MSGVFLSYFPFIILRQGLLLNLGLASQQGTGTPLSLPSQC